MSDPEVHGVAAYETGTAHLLLDTALQCGLDIAEEEIRLLGIGRRELRLEVRKHVEIGLEGLAIVHVGGIHARPEECFTRNLLQALKIDFLTGEQRAIFCREIITDDTDYRWTSEITGAQRNI